MHSLESGFLEKQPIPHSLLRAIRLLGEYRGKEALFMQQTPQMLESLRQVAIIQSTESSNRIEGIEAPADRIKNSFNIKPHPRIVPNRKSPVTVMLLRRFTPTMPTCRSPWELFFNSIATFISLLPSRAGDGR